MLVLQVVKGTGATRACAWSHECRSLLRASKQHGTAAAQATMCNTSQEADSA